MPPPGPGSPPTGESVRGAPTGRSPAGAPASEGPPDKGSPPDNLRRAALAASIALFAFAALMGLALTALFARSDDPWSFRSFVALVSMGSAVPAGVLVWRMPSRQTVGAGIAVTLFSLLRVGAPGSWGAASFAILAVTMLLLVPQVLAFIILPRG